MHSSRSPGQNANCMAAVAYLKVVVMGEKAIFLLLSFQTFTLRWLYSAPAYSGPSWC